MKALYIKYDLWGAKVSIFQKKINFFRSIIAKNKKLRVSFCGK